jgi:uncharacterized C2H2 Zn-finger protein
MGTILIRCPRTRSYIATGIMMDHATFFETDIGQRRLTCPDCGEVHHWRQQDAWLREWPERETPTPSPLPPSRERVG